MDSGVGQNNEPSERRGRQRAAPRSSLAVQSRWATTSHGSSTWSTHPT